MENKLYLTDMKRYENYLIEEERSDATIKKYMRDIKKFYEFLPEDKIITKVLLVAYKKSISLNYKISSINSMIVAINSMLKFLKMTEFKLKLYKIQKSVFCDETRELTKEEYRRLLHVAQNKRNEKLYHLIQTICGTGIRVSEHKYISVEALKNGKAIVHNKGKTRTILIPKKLATMLLKYCKTNGIQQGSIFVTKSGVPLNRSNIWLSMKKLCKEANVEEEKVFPHNLRHLFARTYYKLQRDVVRLADILGHSSIETTRIYTITSTKECEQSMSKMDLIE